MAEFSMKREVRHGSVSYRLEGVFNGQAAFDLKRAIQNETGRVVLDFSRIRQFFDFGLAAFATELRSPECQRLQVELLGLGLHHRRLLHYFGLELERGPSASMNDDVGAESPSTVTSLAPA